MSEASKTSFSFSDGMDELNLSTAADVLPDDDSVVSVTPRPPVARSTRSGTSGMSSTRFMSTKSRSSTGSSVGGGSGAGFKATLFYVEDSKSYCAGKVQTKDKLSVEGTNRACIKPGCTAKGHQKATNKLWLTDNTLYIRSHRNNIILCDLALPRNKVLSEETWEYLTTSTNTVVVWRAEITAILAQHASLPGGILNVDTSNSPGIDELSELASPGQGQVQAAIDAMSTPTGAGLKLVARRIEENVGAEDESVDSSDFTDGALSLHGMTQLNDSEDAESFQKFMKEEWQYVAQNFDIIQEKLRMFEGVQRVHKTGLMESLVKIDDKFKLVDTKIHVAVSNVGDDQEVSDANSKTVWQAIKEVGATVIVVMELGEKLQRDQAKFATELVGGLQEFKSHYRHTVHGLAGDLRLTNNTAARLSLKVDDTNVAVNKIVGGFNSATSTGPTLSSFGSQSNSLTEPPWLDPIRKLRAAMSQLADRVLDLERLGATGQTQSSLGASSITAITDRLDAEVLAIHARLDDAKNKSTIGKPYKVGILEINSMADIKSMFGLPNVKNPSISTTFDLFGALMSMASKGHGGKDRADEYYSATRTRTDVDTNDNMSSMDFDLPTVLFAKNGSRNGTVDRAKGLQACESHERWRGTGRDSFAGTISDQLQGFCSQIRSANQYDGGPGSMLAEGLCSRLDTQWKALDAFVSDTHRQLVVDCGFTAGATWALVGRYMAAIFGDMREFRRPLARIYDTSTIDNQVQVLWGIVQATRVLDEFIEARFTSHPSIVAEVGLFMLTERVDPSKYKKLVLQVDSLEGDVSTLKKELKRLREEFEGLKKSQTTDRNNTKNELGIITKKLKN